MTARVGRRTGGIAGDVGRSFVIHAFASVLFGLVVTACGTGSVGTTECDEDGDCRVGRCVDGACVTTLGDAGNGDGRDSVGEHDVDEGQADADDVAADGGDDAQEEHDAPDTAGATLSPCESDAECGVDPCVPTTEGGRCATSCAEDGCPEDATCVELERADGTTDSRCLPRDVAVCEACSMDADCAGGFCVDLVDGPSCARPCVEGDCPAGFSCDEEMRAGTPLCLPITDVCVPCFDRDEDGFGVGSACEGPDCDDLRADVHPGAEETCDGTDQDCDGVADDGFDLMTDPSHCGMCGRSCAFSRGVARCAAGRCELAGCSLGFGDCDGVASNGCEAVLNACGGCEPIEGAAGDDCGPCDTGTLICAGPDELLCTGASGDEVFNACGGCGEIAEELGAVCGTCDTGAWACAGPERVDCDGDLGVDALNSCGGCGELESEAGTPCGVCNDGEWTCVGEESVECVDAELEPASFWRDDDGDGFGNRLADPITSCVAPEGFAARGDDCDDLDPDINPSACEACDGRDNDCDDTIDELDERGRCADAGCADGLACEEGGCREPCGGVRCGADESLCCEGAEVCILDSCVVPGETCEFTEDCAIDEICEPSLERCLSRDAVPVCEFRPPVGEFEPAIGCRWTPAGLSEHPERDDVVMTPVVVNLTDDNGDGRTDRNDVPDIAFLTYDLSAACCNISATLRIVSGQCEEDGTMRTLASISAPNLTNDTGLAAADLDGDGVAEIVAVGIDGRRPQGTIAFRRTRDDGTRWETYWHNETYPTYDVHTRGGPAISIADLEGDGRPEVVIGNVVLNGRNGRLVWNGVATSSGGGGIGNNGFLGPAATVADLDRDGRQEVIAGNTVYESDGAVRWTFDYRTSNSSCGGSLPCDGFNAVGDFDDDDDGEVVIVRRGEVFVLDTDGTQIARIVLPSGGCSFNESGPPTVADFDGDGRPEIGTASADFYVVADLDCIGSDRPAACQDDGVLWRVENVDCSSRVTASSVFDFEGDGAAEVVYADEVSFRIFDGRTGRILYSDDTFGSHTRLEMPVIADVDNDGNAEIVIGENGSRGGTPGLEVWADSSDNWVRTRRVWNQHGYSVTNVTEDGEIPRRPETNWLNERLNNFRQNVQPGGLFDAPNLVLAGLRSEPPRCQNNRELTLFVTVANEGALSVAPGERVRLRMRFDAGWETVAEARTSTRLFPGSSEEVAIPVTLPELDPDVLFDFEAMVDPARETNECDETDNLRRIFDIPCDPS